MQLSSTIQFLIVFTSAILYGIGDYGSYSKRELLKTVGIVGIGLILLNLFWTGCPGSSIFQIFQIAAVVIITQIFVWLYFRIFKRDDNDPDIKESYHPNKSDS